MPLPRAILFHLPVFLWYLFALYQDLLLTSGGRLLGASTYGGRWKYLTFINMVLQTSFFGVSVLTDLVCLLPQPGKRVQRLSLRISALQDWLFAGLAFPIGFFVVVSFWLLYAFDRELVYPKILDQIIPTWMNHAMHSVVLLLLTLELILVPHHCPSRKGGMALLVTFCSSYILWVLWIRHRSAIWVYPILEALSPVGVGIFLTVAVLVTIALYVVGEKLHHWRWGCLRVSSTLEPGVELVRITNSNSSQGLPDQCVNESCFNQEQAQESHSSKSSVAGSDPDMSFCPDSSSPTITPTISQSLSKLPPLPRTFPQKLLDLQKEGFEHLAGKLDQMIDLMGNIVQHLSTLAQVQAQPAEPAICSLPPTTVNPKANLATFVESKSAGMSSGEPDVNTDTQKEISNAKHTRLPLKTQLPSLKRTGKGTVESMKVK